MRARSSFAPDRIVLLLWILGTGAILTPAQALDAPAPAVIAVDALVIPVSDLDRAVDFFTGVLDFEKQSEAEVAGEAVERLQGVFGVRARIARLKLGAEAIELIEYLAPRGRPVPPDSRSQDRWFQHLAIVTNDMDRAYARLRAAKVRHASSGPQRLPDWNKNAGGIRAFYFCDPDDHVLELIQFPLDKGDPRWKVPTDRLFLGIDHTAIVVADTDASLRFYRDVLGLSVAGESENHGTEQEHLNHVFGARLRITALRAARGPGIEFLEYLAPRDGRPYPPDSRSCDLVAWQTGMVVTSCDNAYTALRRARATLVSPGPVSDLPGAVGFQSGLVVRDPDGHVIRLGQR